MPSTSKPASRVILPILVIIAVAIGALFVVKAELGNRAQLQDASDAQVSQPAAVGTTIPDFSLTSLEGKSAKFSDIAREAKAKVVLVNFWATWCEACVDEMPSLVQLRNSYKSKGFEVVGINLDENPATAVPRAEKELGIQFPVFSDSEGKIADYFDVHAIPLSVVVDTSGASRKILYIENGERNWNDQEIRKMLDRWLSPDKT